MKDDKTTTDNKITTDNKTIKTIAKPKSIKIHANVIKKLNRAKLRYMEQNNLSTISYSDTIKFLLDETGKGKKFKN